MDRTQNTPSRIAYDARGTHRLLYGLDQPAYSTTDPPAPMTTLNDQSWTPATPNPPETSGLSFEQTLESSIHRVRRRLIGRGMLRWTGCVLGVLALWIALDTVIHISQGGRWIMLIILLITAAWTFRRFLLNVITIEPAPSDMALNLSPPTASLAALVDLPKAEPTDSIEYELGQAIRRQSTRHLNQSAAQATLRTQPLYEMLSVCVLIVLLLALTVRSPMLATIGARRVLTPWTQVQWPKRFGITLAQQKQVHPLDRAFVASASIGPSTQDPDAQLRWRILGPNKDEIVRWTTLRLNKQGTNSPLNANGRRYEQLIPLQSLSSKSIPQGSSLQYRIETRDDRSTIQRVQIVHPPKLVGVRARVTLPEYAQSLGAPTARFAQSDLQIDPATRALGPVLAGSSVELAWEFSSQVHEQSTDGVSDRDSEALASSTIVRTQVLDENTSVTVVPVDENGFSPRDSVDVFVRVVADAPPEALINTPPTDLVVGQRAVLDLQSMITDDLGIAETSIVAYITQSGSESPTVLTENAHDDSESITSVTMTARLDLQSSLWENELQPGNELQIRSLAEDIAGLESQSPPRIVRIVEDQDIIRRVETQLGTMSEILRKLDDQQREHIERLRDGESVDPDEQASLTDQIRTRTQAAQQLAERLKQSRIDDAQLTPMLENLSESLDSAQSESEDAAESLEREQNEDSIESMEATRSQLEDAITMLDRGQDTWLATRAIEELRSKVESLLQETKSLGEQTQGKPIDQLGEDERSMLEKILDKQKRVEQDARETIDALDEQADALDQNNPTGAQGIRDAATQGRNAGIEEQLSQAGDELSQNQTSSAAATQEQVLEELDKMLEQIEEAQRNRDSALRRKLASLIESIGALIEDQEQEITRLDAQLGNLDQSLIALRDNTLAVRDEASAAFPETQAIADSLTSATGSQAQAIVSLRADPADLASARQSELAAVLHLQAALDEANKQDQAAADRQTEQLRTKLKEQYQEALDEQVRMTTETQPMVGGNLTRRQRATARELASQETQLRATLDQMLADTEELSEAPVFNLAHQQIATLLESIADDLGQRSLDQLTVLDQQGVATILASLVEVLGNAQQPSSEEFEDGQNAGGGGQGSGGGEQPVIPPIAQLQLLRTLQQLTATQTRMMNESETPDTSRLDSISQLQRELAQKGQELIEQMNQPPQNDEESTEEPGE